MADREANEVKLLKQYTGFLTGDEFVDDGNEAIFDTVDTTYQLESTLQGSTSSFPYTQAVARSSSSSNPAYAVSRDYIVPYVGNSVEKSMVRAVFALACDITNKVKFGIKQLGDSNPWFLFVECNSSGVTFKLASATGVYLFTTDTLTVAQSAACAGIDITKLNHYEIILTISKSGTEQVSGVLKVNGKLVANMQYVKDTGFDFASGVSLVLMSHATTDIMYIERMELRNR